MTQERMERRRMSVGYLAQSEIARTSRKVLEADPRPKGVEPRIVDYVKSPPSAAEIRAAL